MGKLYQEGELVDVWLNFYHEASKSGIFKNREEDFTSEDNINYI